MKKQKDYTLLLLLIVFLIAALTSCTSNSGARNYGGTQTIKLDAGQRVVNVTWKGRDLWILTKHDTTNPTTYTFHEKSNYGIWEGEIRLVEK